MRLMESMEGMGEQLRSNNFRFYGRLKRKPFLERYTKAVMQPFPLTSIHDYETMTEFAGTIGTPILVDFQQHYQFLEKIMDASLDCLEGLVFALIKLRVPGGGKIPKCLLQPNVLITIDFADEQKKLIQEGISHIAIQDSIIRTRTEVGLNDIQIEYFSSKLESLSASQNLQRFISRINELGVESVYDNERFTSSFESFNTV